MRIVMLLLLVFLILPEGFAQKKQNKENPAETGSLKQIEQALKYRNIGPFRGGRSAAVTGIPGNRNTYYMGATGGGVWKTTDAGESWKNCSDGYFGGTIGGLAVAESDPNIVFASGGEVTIRGNVSHGYGIWKSTNAGDSWEYMGLKEGQYIPRIRIHPREENLVYAAVLGHVFGPNEERGIYRSTDGGKSWEKILYVSPQAGACDLILDPVNPRILYASTWQVLRTPYSLESGGAGSGLWKSTDGGDHWTRLDKKAGFPDGPLGIIGVSVSPSNHKRIWAIVEAPDGGLFRSEDAGESWRRVSADRNLRQRAWYYSRVYADPKDADGVYVLNVGFHHSTDGGSNFSRIGTPHGDHHDLWIDPEDPKNIIIADDGGAQVSHDQGNRWSSMMNQPTAQFYRLTTDTHFPYRIYAAQQDNSTVRILHRSMGYGIGESDWESTAGGESGWIAPDPGNPEIVYGGSYGGYLVRMNHETGEYRRVDVYPDNPMGYGAVDIPYRFQWNFPILFSRHEEGKLYTAAQMIFTSTNEGQSWEAISPDLSRNDPATLQSSGGPITKDNTGVEYYGTVFALAESIHEKGVIWAGSDDGLIHLTQDDGKNWQNITPPAKLMPEWTMINSIEPHPFVKGGLYVAATAYKKDDFTPYLLVTLDYGKSWKKITTGIAPDHFTRVIRADHQQKGLLFAGTESGIYISVNDGESWTPLQLNLPIVPVTDLCIRENELIVATQGRAIWILDDLDFLRQSLNKNLADKPFLYQTAPAYRFRAGIGGVYNGENPPSGPVVRFYLPKEVAGKDRICLRFLNEDGQIIRSFETNVTHNQVQNHSVHGPLTVTAGVNTFNWDMMHPGAKTFPGMILWSGRTSGPMAAPGSYTVRLVCGIDSVDQQFDLIKNPLSSASVADLKEQETFLLLARDKLSEIHQVILDIRQMKDQLSGLKGRIPKDAGDLLNELQKISTGIEEIEKALYQTKNRSGQDPLNYPIRLNNKLAALASTVSSGDYKPTDQAYRVWEDLLKPINAELQKFEEIRTIKIPALNKKLKAEDIPYIK